MTTPQSLPLPGCGEIVRGRLYSLDPPSHGYAVATLPPGRTGELLAIGRARVIEPAMTYAAFADAAQLLLAHRLPRRLPTDLELILCRLPVDVLRQLAAGLESAKVVLDPYLDPTVSARSPPGGEVLQLVRFAAPREAVDLIARSAPEVGRVAAIKELARRTSKESNRFGHRWTAHYGLKGGALPQPWALVWGYQGPFDALKALRSPLREEADRLLGTLYGALHAPAQLRCRLVDLSGPTERQYHGRIAGWLLRRAGYGRPIL